MSNDNTPKIILSSPKENNYNFLSSKLKTYRLRDTIIIGKIVIIPQNVHLKITNNKYDEVFNENKFNTMKYLKEVKLIENNNSNQSFELINKKKNLYDFFIKKGKKYWCKQTKTNIDKIYKKECLNLGLEINNFINKNYLLEYIFENPVNDYFLGENNIYFISNKSNSNMSEGLSIKPIEGISTYEYFIKILNSSYVENILDDLLLHFQNNNIAFVIDNISVVPVSFLIINVSLLTPIVNCLSTPVWSFSNIFG